MPKETMICTPLFQGDLDKCLETANKALKMGIDMLELRVDALQNPDTDDIINFLDDLNIKTIVTNRKTFEGGFFKGSEVYRTDILKDVAVHADYVDIELATEEKLRSKVIRAANSSIVSYHNFNETPTVGELLEIIKEERELGDLAKFAVMPNNMGDTLKVLEVLAQVENTIGISMGEMGSYTRFAAALFGSPITYASLDEESAPGQLGIELTKLFLDKLGR